MEQAGRHPNVVENGGLYTIFKGAKALDNGGGNGSQDLRHGEGGGGGDFTKKCITKKQKSKKQNCCKEEKG
jgi:hypothetical protein